MITVQLLGGACLRSGDAPLTGPPAQRHRIALLTLIVAASPKPLSRDRAMALLWPERDLANSRRLLNLATHVLRSALGESAISSTGDGLLLNPGSLRCDLHELRSAIAAGDADRVVELYTGPLLDGFHLDESTELGYWLDEQRGELARAYTSALLTLAERQQRSGDVHGRVRTCRRLVAADPYSGAHAKSVMRALDDAGDRVAAIQHAAEHARRLRVDLELDPDPSVAALAEELKRSVTRRDAAQDGSGARAATVAVLPFVNFSADPENEYFADGITEDVIAHLSKIRSLSVISRTSVMPFKRRQHALKEIGERLGVTTLLDGSVRHVGDRVRIVATLVDAASNRDLWAETYDRQLTDIFAIQTDVALHIARALQAELTHDEQERVLKEPTRNVQAYRLFQHGRRSYIQYTQGSIRRAIELFGRAIALDPGFALAYAHIAMAYSEQGESGNMAPEAAYRQATEAVGNALRLDPELGEAHCILGHLATCEFDWARAEREFKRALELSPSSADTYDLYGRMCAGVCRHDDAIALSRRAQELDPLAHRMDLVTVLLRAERYDEALVRAEEAAELNPTDGRILATLGWAYFLSGRRGEGLRELQKAVSVAPDNTMWLGQLGEAYGLSGDMENARLILEQLQDRARTAFVSPYHFAYVHAGLGDAERALDWLERAVAGRTGPTYGIKGAFLLSSLRDHPRFRALLRQMNLDD